MTVEAGLTVSISGILDVRAELEAFLEGTKFGEFVAEKCEKDVSRENGALAWVHAWIQYFGTELAMGKVVGKLQEKGGRHRQAPLSDGLAAQFAGTAIASGKAGRLLNVQVGPPKGLHAVDPIVLINSSEIGGLDGDNVGVVLLNPEATYMGRKVPVGLKALLEPRGIVSAERALHFDSVYAGESAAAVGLLEEFQTRKGYWNEMNPGSAQKGGDVSWFPGSDQDDTTYWPDQNHLLRGRLIWTGEHAIGAKALPTNGETARINEKVRRLRKQTTR